VSEERLAAFHHRGTLVTHASRGDHEGLTSASLSPLFFGEGGKRLAQDVVLVSTIVTPL
jgi:hypothetical protein